MNTFKNKAQAQSTVEDIQYLINRQSALFCGDQIETIKLIPNPDPDGEYAVVIKSVTTRPTAYTLSEVMSCIEVL